MMSVGRIAETSAVTSATAPKPAERVSEEKSTTLASEHTDKFVKSETGYTPAYTKATVTDNRSNSANENAPKDKTAASEKSYGSYQGKSVRQTKNEAMKDVISKLLGGLASSTPKSTITDQLNSIFKSYGLENIEDDGSEDFWGAEATANRILDFAKSLAGDDDKAFSTLKDAFEKAFGDSEKIWGGKLPSVCYDTLDRVRKGFDDWEKEIAAKNAEKSDSSDKTEPAKTDKTEK